ncbi:MAG: tRNA (mnm(5)s(2)U34)-methyltransferase, partial [Eubacteriales bacterium]
MFRVLQNTVQMAQGYLEQCIKPGAAVVDATVGNGHDTLYLAQKVGLNGRVYGFDIQEQAIRAAAEMISEKGYSSVVHLFCTGHENLSDYVSEPIDAMIFNLGYLPGSDHNIVTKPESTVIAVTKGLALLKPGGLICIVVYPGHASGQQERQVLETFLQGLDKKEFCVGKL